MTLTSSVCFTSAVSSALRCFTVVRQPLPTARTTPHALYRLLICRVDCPVPLVFDVRHTETAF